MISDQTENKHKSVWTPQKRAAQSKRMRRLWAEGKLGSRSRDKSFVIPRAPQGAVNHVVFKTLKLMGPERLISVLRQAAHQYVDGNFR